MTQSTLTSIDDVRCATGRSRHAIVDALGVAAPLLQHVGIKLHQLKDAIGLRPGKDVTDEQAAIEQRRHATRGLDQRTAKLTSLALSKPVPYGRLPGHLKPAAQTLYRLGILVPGSPPDSRVLSEDTHFSLTGC
jgi:hypothetical protein